MTDEIPKPTLAQKLDADCESAMDAWKAALRAMGLNVTAYEVLPGVDLTPELRDGQETDD